MSFRTSLLAVVAIAAACSSPSSRIARMYESLKRDIASPEQFADTGRTLAERHAERAAEVRELVDAGEVTSPQDRFRAAVLLVETDDIENLQLAESLAMQAGNAGEPLGFRVAAEAIDKRLVKLGEPQRFGTQYEWIPALRSWRLYPLDPTTTDEQRRAMGVPPLLEIYEGEKRMNQMLRVP